MKKILFGIIICLTSLNLWAANNDNDNFKENAYKIKKVIELTKNHKCNPFLNIFETKNGYKELYLCNENIILSKRTSVQTFETKCKDNSKSFMITLTRFEPFRLATYEGCKNKWTFLP